MNQQDMFQSSDVEEFAEYLGLNGQDADLFYESYYAIHDAEDWMDDIDNDVYRRWKSL